MSVGFRFYGFHKVPVRFQSCSRGRYNIHRERRTYIVYPSSGSGDEWATRRAPNILLLLLYTYIHICKYTAHYVVNIIILTGSRRQGRRRQRLGVRYPRAGAKWNYYFHRRGKKLEENNNKNKKEKHSVSSRRRRPATYISCSRIAAGATCLSPFSADTRDSAT